MKYTDDNAVQSPFVAADAKNNNNLTTCYAILVAYTAFLFGVSQKAIYELDQKIIPFGDAMTYASFFFRILDQTKRGIGSTISLIVEQSYNWLQDFLILIFFPVLFNERGSLIIINFVLFLISTILVFRTALSCKVPRFWAFCAALLFAGMPWHSELRMEFSLTSLMPDTVYMHAFLCASILLCHFVANPYSRPIAIFTGVALSGAIWSRWNAIINLSLPIAGFCLAIVTRFTLQRNWPTAAILKNFAVLALVCLVCAAIYFGLEYRAILDYGFKVAVISSFDWPTKMAGAGWLLLNMPGLAIAGQWFVPNTLATPPYAVVLTILGHVIVVSSVASGARKILATQQSEVLVGALGVIGAAIFYLDILLALTTFGGFYARPQFRELHLVEPAFVGLVCCSLSLFGGLFSGRLATRFQHMNHWAVYAAIGILVALNSGRIVGASFEALLNEAMWTSPDVTYGLPSPATGIAACDSAPKLPEFYLPNEDLKNFLLRLRDAAGKKPTSFFWYGLFNEYIADYYTAQANLPPLVPVQERSPNDHFVWFPTFTPKEAVSEAWFREWLKYVLSSADFVVIPEKARAFNEIWSSPIVAYHDDIVAAVNSPELAPDYLVWGVVEERNTRVLVLKRRDPGGSDGGLEPFPRTWGTPAQVIGRDFKGALMVPARPRTPIDPTAKPQLQFSYEGYNIVRFGDLYVGASREFAGLDVRAVMTNAAPPPPQGQFLVAADVASLEHAIDAATMACPHPPSEKPLLLFTYKDFHIVHIGELYAGIAADAGLIDVDAVLANKAPPPPPTKFVVARDLVTLEAAIDRLATNPILRLFKHAFHKAVAWLPRKS